MNSQFFRHDILAFSAILSLAFSAGAHLADPLLNDDGILYLRTAQAFLTDGVAGAFGLYEWPWHSIAIGLLQDITGMPLQWAAQAINAALASLMVVGFVSLCREAGGDRLTLLFAAMLILAHAELNEYRSFVIRDFGFWAFSLCSLLALMRYARNGRYQDVLLWSGCILAAFLLRTEALFLALAGPLSLFASKAPWRQRFAAYLKFNTLLLALIPVGAVCLLAYPDILDRFAATSVYQKWVYPLLQVKNELWRSSAALGEIMLNEQAEDLHLLFLLASLAAIVVTELLFALSLPAAAILGYGLWKLRLSPPPHIRWPILFYAAASLVYLSAFVLFHRFLQGRHPMLLALLIMLPAPFFLRQIYSKAIQLNRQKAFFLVLAIVLSAALVDGFVSFGHSKRHLVDALAWMEANAGANAAVRTNSQKLAFHSGRPVDWDEVLLFENEGEKAVAALAATGAYWLVEVNHDEPALQAALRKKVKSGGLLELSRFANSRGDSVIVYREAASASSAARPAPNSFIK